MMCWWLWCGIHAQTSRGFIELFDQHSVACVDFGLSWSKQGLRFVTLARPVGHPENFRQMQSQSQTGLRGYGGAV